MINQAKEILKRVFGYDEFISLQAQVIENVLAKRDTLAIMPTGGGKSLCYQIPALIFEGLTIVVSPLISLMKDQVEQLHQVGVNAVLLNSSLSPAEYRENIKKIQNGTAKLLYMAPETLLKPNTMAILASAEIDCFAIDEAHCISAWGHDFRPEYRQLAKVSSSFTKAVCIALTATATPRVRQDIKESLGFENSNEFVAGFDRKNLFISIESKDDPFKQLLAFLSNFSDDAGIIYCLTRKQVDDLTLALKVEGFSVCAYHAGLSENERNHNQEIFIKDDVHIIVATVAFGMGIDKSNVRFVIHYDLPMNIERYYQEIGRAGRDGVRSDCLLLFSYSDIRKIRYFIDQKQPEEKKIAEIHLAAMLGFIQTDECRRVPLLNYFGESSINPECGMCDNCLEETENFKDLTIAAKKFLSCVKRTGERFGVEHIIDVLRGAKTKKMLNFRHDKLSTYGIGTEYSKKEWQQLFRQFFNKGLIVHDMEFGGLKLTLRAWDVFKDREKVLGRLQKTPESKAGAYKLKKKSAYDFDRDLFEILRQRRKEIADAASVPPYVIFSDKTLIEMAYFFPQTRDNMLNINGVGLVKAAKYAETFLSLIIEYCRKNQIEERAEPIPPKTAGRTASGSKKRYIIVGEAYNSGKSINEIKSHFNIKLSTVLSHLYQYLQDGYSIDTGPLLSLSALPDAQKDKVFEALRSLGPEFLRPIYDALDGTVSYDELSILRLHYL